MASKGEQQIAKLLRLKGIRFETERTFQDLKRGYYRFDFYLPDFNTVIEIDGIQHFVYTKFFHKKKSDFKKAQERDRKKNSYCLAHGIILYRIPYWELENIQNFSDILNSKFLVFTIFHNDLVKIPKEYIPKS